jgi:hypothetical protein
MRTTVDIDDSLYRRAKAAASLKGTSLKRFFAEALRRELERAEAPKPAGRRVQLPLVRSSAPASRPLDGDRVAEILEEEELNVPS